MANEFPPGHQQETKPNPDPTVATNDAVARAVLAERDYVNGEIRALIARLDAADKATAIRLATIDNIPNLIIKEVTHLHILIEEQLAALAARTAEQKADTTKALTDALAAQKEAVANQTNSSEKSITKSETATTERIKGVEALLGTQAKSTDDKIGDLKDRVVAIEATRLGGQAERIDHRQVTGAMMAAAGLGFTLLIGLITLIGFLINKTP